MKIKVTKQEKEFEGEITEGKVTPFGTSAHISFSKKHTGKIVSIILPTKTEGFWLLTPNEKDRLIKTAKDIIEENNGNLRHYRLELLEDLSKERFNFDSLKKIVSIVESEGKEKRIIEKLNKLYGE